MRRRLLAPLAVAAAVAGATTGASLRWPVLPPVPVATAKPIRAPVLERSLVCPELSGARRTTARATLVALPDPAASGKAAMTRLRGSYPVQLPALRSPGTGAHVDVRVPGGPVRVETSGSLSADVAAEVVTRADTDGRRGLAEARCTATSPDMWFVGGSTAVGASASLLLTNPGDVSATADVSLLTTTGRVAPRRVQGVEVPARASLQLTLESIAPEVPALATHVVVRSGRLGAFLLDTRHRAKTPLGFDYVPTAAAPARSAVVPGFVGGPGGRRVFLGVPGEEDATVELRVVSSEGAFVPAGLNALRVAAGTVAAFDVAAVLGGRPAAVVVTSDVPVVAGGSTGQIDPVTHQAEFAWSAATSPLNGPALLPDNRVRGGAESVLVLTAPGTAATLVLSGLTPGHPPVTPAQIVVPAGRTVAVRLQGLTASGQFSLVVTPTPGSGTVYGTRVLFERWTHGTRLSQLTLERTDATVRLPGVIEDPAAGTP